jgi:hypothetical protein
MLINIVVSAKNMTNANVVVIAVKMNGHPEYRRWSKVPMPWLRPYAYLSQSVPNQYPRKGSAATSVYDTMAPNHRSR